MSIALKVDIAQFYRLKKTREFLEYSTFSILVIDPVLHGKRKYRFESLLRSKISQGPMKRLIHSPSMGDS